MPPRFNALIVEGTHGIGKSTLIDAMLRIHIKNSGARKIRSLLHLAQTHTYGPIARAEDSGTLTVEQNINHLASITQVLETLQAGVLAANGPPCFVLIDTLYITHCARPGVVSWDNVAEIDQRMAQLGVKLLFLKASAPTIWKRAIEDATGTQFLEKYASKFGRTHKELHDYFVREQAMLAGLAKRSCATTKELAVDGDLCETAASAYNFWVN